MSVDQTRIDQRLRHFVMLRDWVREQDAAHKEKTASAKQEMEKIKGELIEFLKTTGLKNGSSIEGTFYRTLKYSATINDSHTFMNFVIAGELWDLIDKKANAAALAEFAIENDGVLPPGVTLTPIEDVNVNRPR